MPNKKGGNSQSSGSDKRLSEGKRVEKRSVRDAGFAISGGDLRKPTQSSSDSKKED